MHTNLQRANATQDASATDNELLKILYEYMLYYSSDFISAVGNWRFIKPLTPLSVALLYSDPRLAARVGSIIDLRHYTAVLEKQNLWAPSSLPELLKRAGIAWWKGGDFKKIPQSFGFYKSISSASHSQLPPAVTTTISKIKNPNLVIPVRRLAGAMAVASMGYQVYDACQKYHNAPTAAAGRRVWGKFTIEQLSSFALGYAATCLPLTGPAAPFLILFSALAMQVAWDYVEGPEKTTNWWWGPPPSFMTIPDQTTMPDLSQSQYLSPSAADTFINSQDSITPFDKQIARLRATANVSQQYQTPSQTVTDEIQAELKKESAKQEKACVSDMVQRLNEIKANFQRDTYYMSPSAMVDKDTGKLMLGLMGGKQRVQEGAYGISYFEVGGYIGTGAAVSIKISMDYEMGTLINAISAAGAKTASAVSAVAVPLIFITVLVASCVYFNARNYIETFKSDLFVKFKANKPLTNLTKDEYQALARMASDDMCNVANASTWYLGQWSKDYTDLAVAAFLCALICGDYRLAERVHKDWIGEGGHQSYADRDCESYKKMQALLCEQRIDLQGLDDWNGIIAFGIQQEMQAHLCPEVNNVGHLNEALLQYQTCQRIQRDYSVITRALFSSFNVFFEKYPNLARAKWQEFKKDLQARDLNAECREYLRPFLLEKEELLLNHEQLSFLKDFEQCLDEKQFDAAYDLLQDERFLTFDEEKQFERSYYLMYLISQENKRVERSDLIFEPDDDSAELAEENILYQADHGISGLPIQIHSALFMHYWLSPKECYKNASQATFPELRW